MKNIMVALVITVLLGSAVFSAGEKVERKQMPDTVEEESFEEYGGDTSVMPGAQTDEENAPGQEEYDLGGSDEGEYGSERGERGTGSMDNEF